MCGISGAFAFTLKGQNVLSGIEAANQTLMKRGPDGGAVFVTGSAALGHRRLSIIDVSCAGDQPMHSNDARYTIVYNGEIFNFNNLREKYLTEDERKSLRSHSDTEVFLVLFTKFREETFKLLQGFFAAAIYDQQTNELFIVRDRYGKKPLLYYKDEDKIVFASEMKALLKAGIPKEINWDILPIYLQLNYVPQPYSFIKNVQKLPPGHYARITTNGIEESAYYSLSVKEESYTQYSYDEAKAKLVTLMDDAVKMRLISDVPLGAFLSGGIDSSVVVALATRHVSGLKTFSVGYKDNPLFDETAYANLVAKKFNTEHTVFRLGNENFLEHLHSILDYIDEPFADSSAIPTYILSYHTRKHVTVALSGDGGDEVFSGYNKHAAEYRIRSGGFLNNLVKWGGPLWSMLPKGRNSKITNKLRQLDRFAKGSNETAASRYWLWASYQTPEKSQRFLRKEIRNKINKDFSEKVRSEFTSGIKGKDFNEVLLADMNLVLLSDMLVKVDLMSMANSLEIRSPFLDQDVVEFAFGLPSEYKIDSKLKKKILQDAFRSQLPPELYNRPKHGFEIPLLEWFRNELWSMIDDDLLSDKFISDQGIFELSEIRELKDQLRSTSPGDSHATIWALLVFQSWWKNYIG
jgi:asparagine synthase (glutamine-hydrolysing)